MKKKADISLNMVICGIGILFMFGFIVFLVNNNFNIYTEYQCKEGINNGDGFCVTKTINKNLSNKNLLGVKECQPIEYVSGLDLETYEINGAWFIISSPIIDNIKKVSLNNSDLEIKNGNLCNKLLKTIDFEINASIDYHKEKFIWDGKKIGSVAHEFELVGAEVD